jgi:ATP-binding cassette subfamily B protein
LLAFIRAFVYNPELLILDEATSSVDSESEMLIKTATEKLTKGRTSIVIAHSLSTIRQANRIVVMEKGVIIEQGSHDELIALNAHYKNLYDRQYFNQQEP